VLVRTASHRCAVLLLIGLCWWSAACVNPLGPGYTIEQQQIDVHFVPASPSIQITAEYLLRNTGNRPLRSLELRLPAGRRVAPQNMALQWDGIAVSTEQASWNPRNSIIHFSGPWTKGERHNLRIAFQLRRPEGDQPGLNFAADAFFLPAATWAVELPQVRGVLGFGGTPPAKWQLTVRAPADFQIHSSGAAQKVKRSGGEQMVTSQQTEADHYPFVVGGRYNVSEIGSPERVHVWTRLKQDPALLKEASEHILTMTRAYDATFGTRAKVRPDLWIVECPGKPGCFSNFNAVTALLLGDSQQRQTAEMISSDTLLFDPEGGPELLAAGAGPALAASWLGYGQNPGFYEQVPPLSLLPTFAAAVGREAVEGPAYRTQTIQRALGLVPRRSAESGGQAAPREERPEAIRAKSFLFFYGLQDRFGQEAFRRAISEMLYARRSRGFNIADLIAAFNDETHQNTAEFVRIWMKRPGVPDDFRERYESSASRASGAENTAAEKR
jgi:hypothetical protein